MLERNRKVADTRDMTSSLPDKLTERDLVPRLEEANKLLHEIEQIVVDAKYGQQGARGTAMDRIFLGTPSFLKLGARNLASSVFWWLIGTALFLVPMRIFGRPGLEDYLSSFVAAATVSGVAILFGLPSGFTSTSITSKKVLAASQAITDHVKCSGDLDALKDILDVHKTWCQERNRRLSVALGIAWAVIFWYVTNTVLRAPAPNVSAVTKYGFAMLLATFMTLGLAMAFYDAACRMLFQTIDVAFIEARASITATSKS